MPSNSVAQYHDPACGLTLDQHAAQVGNLLPRGRAWPRDPDSTLMQYFRSFADVIKYADDRICAAVEEFFCSTAEESLPTWFEQYGLEEPEGLPVGVDPACIDPLFNINDNRRAELCTALVATGGKTTAYYEAIALSLGWVVTITDIRLRNAPLQAGCFNAGCMQLGVIPSTTVSGSTLGLSSMCVGEITTGKNETSITTGVETVVTTVAAGDPNAPLQANKLSAGCSQLGFNIDPALYDKITLVSSDIQTTTTTAVEVISDDCPAVPSLSRANGPSRGGAVIPHCPVEQEAVVLSDNGSANHIMISIDWPSSAILQESNSPYIDLWPNAGCMAAGQPCAGLRDNGIDKFIKRMEDYVPAHLEILWEYQ
jgi:uncharacterized protein YmfQ (DUF2313 family)